jgi:hypothetical protein
MAGKRSEKPLLSFTTPAQKIEIKISIEKRLHELIEKYCEFCEKTANVRPTKDDIVSGALQRLFERDHAFRRFAGLVRPKAAIRKKPKHIKDGKSDENYALDSEEEAKKTAGWSLPLTQ